jgi:hypothetical protein
MSQQPTMHDGDDEYQLPGLQNNAPPQYGKKKDVNEEITGLIHDARSTMQAAAAAPIIAALRGGGGGAENNEINTQMVTMFTTLSNTLTGLVGAEREARQRAESATNDAQQKYFTSQADMIKQLYERANKPPDLPKTMSELENYRQWNSIITEAAKTVMPAPAPAPASGPTQLDIEMKRMDLDNQRLTLQMQHAHDIALEEMKLKIANFNLEIAKFKRGEDKNSSWLDEILNFMGLAVQQGVNGANANGAPGISQQVPTQGGLVSAECGNCHQKMVYPPDAEFFSCGKCGIQYTTKRPSQGPGSADPESAAPAPPKEDNETSL